jgi:hypothetical protein
MSFHRASSLNHQNVHINELTIHSLEMGTYLAEADYDGHKAFLSDDNHKPLQFHSVGEVKQALGRCTINKAYLVHQSAYDEMCGSQEKVDNTLKVQLFLPNVTD